MAHELRIDDSLIHDAGDCYVIAEIGHNHQGDVEKCKALFREAKACGANAVKLQKRDNRSLYTAAMYQKPYENENSFGRTYGEHREFLEFGRDAYVELQAYARALGVTFFATAFDVSSANFLAELDVPAYKIASGDLKNIPLIQHVAHFGKPMIVSTGGGLMEDIERVYEAVLPLNPQLAFLHCTATYPTLPEEMNLRVIATLRQRFPELVIGLSDHYNGIAMSVAAYVLGARIIEKHFTLNHTWKGTDHALSLEPIGLGKMIRDLQRTCAALGDGVKQIFPNEQAPIQKMGKMIVAARELAAGHVLMAKDLAFKSPADGLPPYEVERVLGRALRAPLAADEAVRFEQLDEVRG